MRLCLRWEGFCWLMVCGLVWWFLGWITLRWVCFGGKLCCLLILIVFCLFLIVVLCLHIGVLLGCDVCVECLWVLDWLGGFEFKFVVGICCLVWIWVCVYFAWMGLGTLLCLFCMIAMFCFKCLGCWSICFCYGLLTLNVLWFVTECFVM